VRKDKSVYYVKTFDEAYRAPLPTMRGLLQGNFSGDEKRKWSFCSEDRGPYKIEVSTSDTASKTKLVNGNQQISTTLPVAEFATGNTDDSENGETWTAYLASQKDFWQKTLKRKAELSQQVSQADKALSDIYHYVEDTKFNASQGYKILMKEKEILQQRRKAKKELQRIHIFEHAAGEVFCTSGIEEQLQAVNTSQYQPRVLTELFKTGKI
jgi:virulence-associated protein VapD